MDGGYNSAVLSIFFCWKLPCRYHPDKNADDPIASEKFQEATFSYNILSDPDKRRQYDSSGFEVTDGVIEELEPWADCFSCNSNAFATVQAIEADSQELELDLSSLNTVNTVFAALFR